MEHKNKKHFALIEINDEATVRTWSKKLMGARHSEAVASLREEGVDQETVFLVEIDGKQYMAFYMEGECLPADVSLPINQEHRDIMQTVRVRKLKGELLYDLNSNDT